MLAAQSAVQAITLSGKVMTCLMSVAAQQLPNSMPNMDEPERTLCMSGGARQEGSTMAVQLIAMQRYGLLLQH